MGKKRILLVDDEAIITRTMKLFLEGTGRYQVVAENQGSLALETARMFQPDLIMLDLVMPETDGSEVAEQLREDDELKNTPVVFLRALVRAGEVSNAGGMIGGYPFIAKPLDPDKIVECIERHAA